MTDSAAVPTEPTAHIFEITDPGQLEAVRESSGVSDGPIRAAGIVLTAVDRNGVLSLFVAPPGYALWARPADQFESLFSETFGIDSLPASIPWSELSEYITVEHHEDQVSPEGEIGENLNRIVVDSADDREIVIPLDWKG